MSSNPETIVLETPEEHVAKITLYRPERLNALNSRMVEELKEALRRVNGEDRYHVLILTGAGRSFCAGADMESLTGGQDRELIGYLSPEGVRRALRRGLQSLMLEVHKLDKPTIAMVNGVAAGAGFDLACACDIRIGCPKTRFMSAFVRVGLFPGTGGTWFYPRVLGNVAKAAELLFTGDFLEAEEAFKYGLLNHLVPEEELEKKTMEIATKIAQGPPIAIRLAKIMLYRGLELDLDAALEMAAAAETITLLSEDHKEGVAAFKEKRKPVFRGW